MNIIRIRWNNQLQKDIKYSKCSFRINCTPQCLKHNLEIYYKALAQTRQISMLLSTFSYTGRGILHKNNEKFVYSLYWAFTPHISKMLKTWKSNRISLLYLRTFILIFEQSSPPPFFLQTNQIFVPPNCFQIPESTNINMLQHSPHNSCGELIQKSSLWAETEPQWTRGYWYCSSCPAIL